MKDFSKILFIIAIECLSVCITECPQNCECIVDDVCDSCKNNQFYSNDCSLPCSQRTINCEECIKEEGECTKCNENKYYSKNCIPCGACPGGDCDFDTGKCSNQDEPCTDTSYYGTKCADKCNTIENHQNCQNCTKDGLECTECVSDKYYGKDCTECFRCPGGTCEFSGICKDKSAIYCKDETFKGDDCNTRCNNDEYTNCQKCMRNGTCTECVSEKFWGESCQNVCPNCPEEECKINGICKDDKGDCKGKKYYGDYCNLECPGNCETCTRDGQKCLSCKENTHYGQNCEISCENCPEGVCDFYTGECLEEGECSELKYYGEKCQDECNGISETCDRCYKNGTCHNCTDLNHYGSKCIDLCNNCPDLSGCHMSGICIDQDSDCYNTQFYGDKCNTSCKILGENCQTCNRGENCTTCSDNKYFGRTCDTECLNCPQEICFINGTCHDNTSNCKESNFYGPNCDKECKLINLNCAKCNRNETCSECNDISFFGDKCDQPCNCPHKKCHINGTCVEQDGECYNNSYYGRECDIKCDFYNQNCETCDIKGKCLSCYNNTHYDDNCKTFCDNCPSNKCYINGNCTDIDKDCIDDQFYGPKCKDVCNAIHWNCDRCHRNKSCIECNDIHYFGPECQKGCFECPKQLCEINGTCVDQDGPCNSPSKYGEKCTTDCTSIDEKCIICNRKGICTQCINSSYYGENCTTFCSNCPNNECKINGECINEELDCPDNHFYGNSCNIPCNESRDYCDTCTRKGRCTSCKSPNFWGYNCTKFCENCPGHECKNNGTCIDQDKNCIGNNYTGERCDEECSSINPNCLYCNRSKECFECVNKTLYGNECNIPCDLCPGTCDNDGICYNKNDSCINDSYTGPSCSELCSNKHPNCFRCDRNNTCLECIDRTKFGEKCETQCGECPENGLCNITGICDNQDKLCKNNSYTGPSCSVLCSVERDNCKYCDRNNTCLECFDRTKYGNYCNFKCSNCPGNASTCNITGDCDEQELLCLDSSFTGKNCQVPCSNKYQNCLKCDRKNICFECEIKTYYGDRCDLNCSNCPGEEDEPGYCYNNGICVNNYSLCDDPSFTGESCNVSCSLKYKNCEYCDRNNKCFECYNKTEYGDYCNSSCLNCPGDPGYCYNNGTCYNSSYKCDNDSFTGENCSLLCSEVHPNCLRCDRNFRCIECINQSYYGDNCTNECFNCPGETNKLCDIDGICYDNNLPCKNDTMTGRSCNESCLNISDNCDRCNRDYECVECFNKTYYGNNCTNECFNCPGKPNEDFCYINGTCYDSQTLCDNNTMTGPGCNISCDSINNNCYKCDRDFKCIECFNQSYYGDNCTNECFNCPGETNKLCDIDGICYDNNSSCRNDNMTGPSCNESCLNISDNCDRCNRNYECTLCFNKTRYGKECKDDCSNCPGETNELCNIDGICYDNNSSCRNDNMTGPSCNESCLNISDNCDKCNRDYECTLCFNKTRYGKECRDDCSNCPGETNELCNIDGICYDNNTSCRNDNMTGPSCNESCLNISDNCDRCNRDYKCVECINQTYYGKECKDKCFNCPGDPGFCDINGTCINTTSLCDDPTKTGPDCNISCDSININCYKCDRDFKCIECFNQSYYGDNCTTECFNCPGETNELCNIDGICYDSDSPCRNDNMTGPSCNESCLNISDNCDRCNRSYECTVCFDQTRYGKIVLIVLEKPINFVI